MALSGFRAGCPIVVSVGRVIFLACLVDAWACRDVVWTCRIIALVRRDVIWACLAEVWDL